METILFHQNRSYKVADIFVINGVLSDGFGTAQQLEALQMLNSKRKIKKMWIPAALKKTSSSMLTIYLGMHDIYIVSQSLTLDDEGRKISFQYYASSYTNPEVTMKTLRDSVHKAGLQPNENDMRVIQWILNIIPLEKKVILILSIIVFLILLINNLTK